MSAFGYRDIVTIQGDASTGDTAVPDYSTTVIEDVPCRIDTLGGNETYRGRQLEAHLTHVVEMQWMTGITPTMRLSVVEGVHRGAYLNIEHAIVREGRGRARKLELHCVRAPGR